MASVFRLDEEPDEDEIIGVIAALVSLLPRPLTEYTQLLGMLRRTKHGIPGRSRGEITKGYIDGHQIRATASEWKGMK